MATQPKRWPNHADWARSDCIAIARQGRRHLLAELEKIDDPALLRRMAKAIEAFREIEARLMAVGPKES